VFHLPGSFVRNQNRFIAATARTEAPRRLMRNEVRRGEHLNQIDGNAEFMRRDLGMAVQQIKRASGKGPLVGCIHLQLALSGHG
jgi:hypothetical protein